MQIKSIAPWFGSKRGMAPRIVAALGKHRMYFEPFCGSLAVLLEKPPSSSEIVCDLHGDLINLARVLQSIDTARPLYERLARTLCCEEIFEECRDRLLASMPENDKRPRRAYDFFVVSWMERNGVGGTKDKGHCLAIRWTPNGGSSSGRFRSAVDSIPAWHERLRNVQILRRNAFDVLPRISDEPGVVIYADPPYPPESISGWARYQHDFEAQRSGDSGLPTQLSFTGDGYAAHFDDHARLADELRRFKHARVVVSCYECDRYRGLYADWTFIDCTRAKNLTQTARGKHRAEAPEVLIVNAFSGGGSSGVGV